MRDPDTTLLRALDAYLDAAPRTSARAEALGPFTLFIREGHGWPFYARPTPGHAEPITADDVLLARARQRALEVPQAFEWVHELAPSLAAAAERGGLVAVLHPLMHLEPDAFAPVGAPDGAQVRLLGFADDLATARAVAHVGFGALGTGLGTAGVAAARAIRLGDDDPATVHARARLEAGLTVTAAAFLDGEIVAVGAHQPIDDATEVVGVATLPAFRRRGLAAAVTSALVTDALARGVRTVLLTADSDAVARIYARLGFRVVGSAGAAEPSTARAEPEEG